MLTPTSSTPDTRARLLCTEQPELPWICGVKKGSSFRMDNAFLEPGKTAYVFIGADLVTLEWVTDRLGERKIPSDADRDHEYLRIVRINGSLTVPLPRSTEVGSYTTLFDKDGLWYLSKEGFHRSSNPTRPREESWSTVFESFGISTDFPVNAVGSIDVIAGQTYGGFVPKDNPWFGDGEHTQEGPYQWRIRGGTFAILWEYPTDGPFGKKVLEARVASGRSVNLGRLRSIVCKAASINN